MAAMVNVAATIATSSIAATPLSSATLRSGAGSSSLAFGRTVSARKLGVRRSAGVRAAGVDISKVVPQADRILIKLETLAETSSGGVLLPKSAVKFERYLVGEVVAVGSEVKNTEKGKKVLVSDINAYEVNLGTKEKLCFARAADLLAEVE